MKFFKKRKEIMREDDSVYLIRWNLFECMFFSIKLHRILRSDYDCLHDHPWAFVSLILCGGYVEHREIKGVFKGALPGQISYTKVISRIYHPGQVLYRRATDKHKLEIHQPATTLVVTFKKVRPWGFWTKKGWVHHSEYDAQASCE